MSDEKVVSDELLTSTPPIVQCPICEAYVGGPYHVASMRGMNERFPNINYFDCPYCGAIFADPAVLEWMDQGGAIRTYDQDYWQMELIAARQRGFGDGLARSAEAILYARTPIKRFLDIGSGPGYLLDALAYQLPSSADRFYGIELYPPAAEDRTKQPNYMVGALADAAATFQGGVCIEVIEHLTPAMMRSMCAGLAAISDPQACYLFNTGLSDFVRNGQLSYLDPLRRGHIISWSVMAVRKIMEPLGFKVSPIRGKTFAFLAEYQGTEPDDDDVPSRIWKPVAENKAMLHDAVTGSAMYILGFESARAYP